jgi:predicted permease
MRWLDQLRRSLETLFHRSSETAHLTDELQFHLDQQIAENLARGMNPEAARAAALRHFGNPVILREQARSTWSWAWLDPLARDLRFTLRTLRRDSTFTLVAILILGIGIGANVAVFSVVNAVLIRPLPLGNPGQLVRILSKKATAGESSNTYSVDAVDQFRRANRSFSEITGYFAFSAPDNMNLTGSGQPRPITGLSVAQNFFPTLGVQPILGRQFLPEEALPHARPVTLLSYAFWKRQYSATPAIVGQAVSIDNTPVTIVGVLPPSFDFGAIFSPGAHEDLYTPISMDDIRDEGNTIALVGRLKPNVTLPQAQAEADTLVPTLLFSLKHPEYGSGYTARILVMKNFVSGKLRQSLIALWCAVGMILLIVCVNLSNLLLARSAARSKEFALRTALGAARSRIVRQLLTESLVLASAGALLGLALAFAVTTYLAHQTSIALPLLASIRVDAQALTWTILIALLAAAFFGLAPALKLASTSSNLQESLKDGGRGTSDGAAHNRLRNTLVISEVALACILLVGAGLLLRSFLHVLDVDLGFEPSRAAAISVQVNDHDDPATRAALWQNLIRRVSALPGIESAGITDNLPLSRNRSWGISAKGHSYQPGELPGTFVYLTSPGYLNAIGMRLTRGRDISWDDGPKSQHVVIINQTVANHLWPGEDPIGKIAEVNGDTIVIGVIADVRESGAESAAGWQMYLPATQAGPDNPYLVVRTKLAPAQLSSSVMRTLREINPGQPATEFLPIQSLVDHAVSPRRFFVILVSIFALLGLILAALGIYGVISYSVTQRTQEIGIRMALGSSRAQVQLGVLSKTLRLALIGIAIGTIASFAASRLITALLFGTEATDPITFLGMIAILVVIAVLAGYLPARRASRISPMTALRTQ